MKRLVAAMLLSLAAVLVLSVFGWAADTAASAESAAKVLVKLSLSNISLAHGIDALFSDTGLNYIITPELASKDRKVTLSFNGVTFEEALKVLVKSAKITYTVEDGIYIFAPVKIEQSPAKTETSFTVRKLVTAEQPKTDKPTVETVAAQQPITQPEQPAQDAALADNQLLDAYGQPMNMNQGYGYYQPPTFQVGNITILNGYDAYTPPFTLGGNGYSNGYNQMYGQQYQSPFGWQPYNPYAAPYWQPQQSWYGW
ncbi:MAG: STN domain-containing protein [Armatimonadetes bacterium]|nr:STN domain-containing protein [Armatimonadota bacterium]